MKRLVSILFICLLSALNWAMAAGYNDNTSDSWHWYHDKPVSKHGKKKAPKMVPFNKLSAHEQVVILHYYTINAANEATLYPSQKHQEEYVKWQNFWTSHASDFTQEWVELNMRHPELDYSSTHSTLNASAGIYAREKTQKEQAAINKLSKTYGLMFFYRHDSGFSEQMAKLVASFAKAHHFTLLPVSMDGYKSPFLPHTRVNHGQAEHMKVKIFPSLYLVNPKTGTYKPVFYTYTALDQMQATLLNIANNWKRDW